MKIGELARAARCTSETVRFYEKVGLLPEPGRTGGNYRSYGTLDVERLRFIRTCRALDMAHDEIRMLLSATDAGSGNCQAVNTLLDDHIRHVDVRIDELAQLKQQLAALRDQCRADQALEACGILRGLAAMPVETAAPRHTHLG